MYFLQLYLNGYPAQTLEIIDWKDGWARVKNPDNVEGYVQENQLLRAVRYNP